MNKILRNLSLVAFLFLASCGDEFLDRPPLTGVNIDNFYDSEQDAEEAIVAAYAALQFELSPGGHFRWFWGDVMSDDSEKGGSGVNDAPELGRLENFQGPVNTTLLVSEWGASYEGIYRANVVLEKVPAIEMSEFKKAEILGEAKFIRAYFHYNLVTMFGGVPLVDHLLAPSEYNAPRNTADEVWAFIETDLLEAIAVLPFRSEYSSDELGRVTKGAAQGLLTKAYLFQKKYSQAESIAADLVNSGEYSLDPSFASIFTLAGENGPGSIFEIQYMNESGGNWGKNNQNEATLTDVFTRARGAKFGGYGFNIPTQSLVDEFFVEGFEDPRLAMTVFREGEAMGDRGIFTKDDTGYPHDYYTRKTFRNKSEEAPFGDVNVNGGTNDRVIRLADVLLMHAEAAYHNGNEGEARNSLNTVRSRVGLADVTASGTDLLQAIYHERRVELALEGHRFFDLVRTGRAGSALGTLGYVEGVHNLFPIPLSQIQVSNGALTQNPGY